MKFLLTVPIRAYRRFVPAASHAKSGGFVCRWQMETGSCSGAALALASSRGLGATGEIVRTLRACGGGVADPCYHEHPDR